MLPCLNLMIQSTLIYHSTFSECSAILSSPRLIDCGLGFPDICYIFLVIISWRLVGSCCPAHTHHPIYTDLLGYIVRMFKHPLRSTFHCSSTQLSWYPIYNLSITPCHLQWSYYHAPMHYPMISQNFHSKIIHPTWVVNPITTILCISQNPT